MRTRVCITCEDYKNCNKRKIDKLDPLMQNCRNFRKTDLSKDKLQKIADQQVPKIVAKVKGLIRSSRDYINFLKAKNFQKFYQSYLNSFIGGSIKDNYSLNEADFKKHQKRLTDYADKFLLQGKLPSQRDIDYINGSIGTNIYPYFIKDLHGKREKIRMSSSSSMDIIPSLYFEFMQDVIEQHYRERCIVCGKSIKGKRRIYCSPKCGNLARVKTHREKRKSIA